LIERMTPDRYAVLGNPVAHSRSPFIHALFAQQTGQALSYEKLLCPMDGFAAAVQAFAASGGRGCNVTVPFKFDVPALAQHLTARAALAGAANVLRFDAGAWWADNTDGVGLLRDIEQGAGQPLRGQRVLLVGAGGAAAGVLGPLLAAQPAQVVVANRSAGKAQALVARHSAWAAQHRSGLLASGLFEPGGPFDVVINASATSLQGAASPVPAEVFAPGALAVDLMYGAAALPWLAWAQAHGARARDGLGMLVEQAAEAFVLWRGVRPDTAPVLQALRSELAASRAA
jgi:shikimate dehydrogenase